MRVNKLAQQLLKTGQYLTMWAAFLAAQDKLYGVKNGH